jgi:two-component system, chemotaxis family, protein-glutamate methylesterase/glutaminase
MPPIRVLVVDDSVVIRRILCDVLASDPALEVAGIASDGHIALAKIEQLKPDVVTLDVEMPNMSGLETIAEIRKLHPKLPVIMFSTLTERGATTTLDALALGASDYVTKPSNTGSLAITMAKIKEELLPTIKGLCSRRFFDRTQTVPIPKKETVVSRIIAEARPDLRIDVLAIGTSTGGPNALAELLPGIPKDFPVPIVIVQHMPALFTRMLAERLNKQCAIKVAEGEAGKDLEPGLAWIAPGNYHMTVQRHGTTVQLAMNQNRPENSCRPAVDVLFRSAVETFGANTLGVVLTGMGSDGVLGSQAIRERGGRVYVQDEASSVVWGMPGQVAAAGWADAIFPLASMAAEINQRVRASQKTSRHSARLVPVNTS